MRVLIISSDPNIAKQNSQVQNRMRFYACVCDTMHIVVINGLGSVQKYDNLSIYPTGHNVRLLAWLRAYRRAKHICQIEPVDVLSSQGPDESGLIAWFLSRRLGIPWQLQMHTDVMSPSYRRASWKERIRYYIARFLIPRANCIRVVSERIKNSITPSLRSVLWRGSNLTEESFINESNVRLPRRPATGLLAMTESRICVLPVYSNLEPFLNAKPDPNTDRRFKNYSFKMVAAGRFVDKEKNFSMLFDVMREFVKVCPDALLVIVGDGPDRRNYESRIMNYGLEENVILERWRNDLPVFYKSFDLFLCSSNYEGWGVAVLEAMASGLPVVMTNVGLAEEVVKDRLNGRVVSVNDVQHFVKAITEFYNNVQMMTELALRGVETAQHVLQQNKKEYLERYKKSFCIMRQESIKK